LAVSAEEEDTARFYRLAAERAADTGVRKLLGDLAAEEDKHEHRAEELRISADDVASCFRYWRQLLSRMRLVDA
jgi:rubrerythrin